MQSAQNFAARVRRESGHVGRATHVDNVEGNIMGGIPGSFADPAVQSLAPTLRDRLHHSRRPIQRFQVFNDDFYDLFPWARDVDPFDKKATEWKPAEWYVANRNNKPGLEPDQDAEVPPAIAFVNRLISLELDDLGADDQFCNICLQPYREGEFPEMPLQLPCGHIFGKDCLLTWLQDIGKDGAHNANCPMCRQKCIDERRKDIGTAEGLKQLLRDVNYLLTGMGPLTLTEDGRGQWEGVKDFVNRYLAERGEADRQRQQRFVRTVQQRLRTDLYFESPTERAERLDEVWNHMNNALLDFVRRDLIGTYMEEADFQERNQLGDEIATHLEAEVPSPLLRLMDHVYEEEFGIYASDSEGSSDDSAEGESISDFDVEETLDLIDDGIAANDNGTWCDTYQLPTSPPAIVETPAVPLPHGLTLEYLESHMDGRPTSSPRTQGRVGGSDGEISWCYSCGRYHSAGWHSDSMVWDDSDMDAGSSDLDRDGSKMDDDDLEMDDDDVTELCDGDSAMDGENGEEDEEMVNEARLGRLLEQQLQDEYDVMM